MQPDLLVPLFALLTVLGGMGRQGASGGAAGGGAPQGLLTSAVGGERAIDLLRPIAAAFTSGRRPTPIDENPFANGLRHGGGQSWVSPWPPVARLLTTTVPCAARLIQPWMNADEPRQGHRLTGPHRSGTMRLVFRRGLSKSSSRQRCKPVARRRLMHWVRWTPATALADSAR